VTSTSLKFTVTSKGYFDPPGSTISFSTSESGGQVYLQQTANAPDAGTLSNVVAPPVAKNTWANQASNLQNAVLGGSTCNDNAFWQVVSGITGENIC